MHEAWGTCVELFRVDAELLGKHAVQLGKVIDVMDASGGRVPFRFLAVQIDLRELLGRFCFFV